MELSQRNILITGAAQGIGKGIAQACLDQGANVYLLDINCLLYTSPSPRDVEESRMPSSA